VGEQLLRPVVLAELLFDLVDLVAAEEQVGVLDLRVGVGARGTAEEEAARRAGVQGMRYLKGERLLARGEQGGRGGGRARPWDRCRHSAGADL
jgi:hypothetical protein